jgi:predicted ribosomally synthesized peptide with SipW-like signal peptide
MKKIIIAACCFLFAIGGTSAYLHSQQTNTNTFMPAVLSCQIEEVFENNTKTSIRVKNTSNIRAYVRLKLLSYRTDDQGDQIGGTAAIAPPAISEAWTLKSDGYYYCTSTVEAGSFSPNLLAPGTSITLQTYTDADGGSQTIVILAQAIQEGTDIWPAS